MKASERRDEIRSFLKLLMILGVAMAVLAGCATLPKDDAQLTEMQFENLMGSRYTEILLVFGNPITKDFMAGVYNTVGMNGANPAGGGDSSPVQKNDVFNRM